MLKLHEVDRNLWFVILKVSLVIFCSTVNSPNRPKTYYIQTKRNCNAQTSGAWDFWDLIKNKYHIIFSGVCTLPILIFALTYLLWNKNLLWPERGDIILITGFSHTFSPQQTADCQYTINLRYWRARRGEISCEIQVHMKFPPIKICLLCGGKGGNFMWNTSSHEISPFSEFMWKPGGLYYTKCQFTWIFPLLEKDQISLTTEPNRYRIS